MHVQKVMAESNTKKLMQEEAKVLIQQHKIQMREVEDELAEWREMEPSKEIARLKMQLFMQSWAKSAKIFKLKE